MTQFASLSFSKAPPAAHLVRDRFQNSIHWSSRARSFVRYTALPVLDNQVTRLREALDTARFVVLSGHTGPDGDTVGACLALHLVLKEGSKHARILFHDPVPKNLLFLPGSSSIERVDEEFQLDDEPDLAVVMDLSGLDRLGRARPFVERAKQIVVFDHHEPGKESFGDIRIVDPTAAATCLILYRALVALDLPIPGDVAQCLLAGIATDTGNFAFSNTTPEALRAAADLIERGGDISVIHEEVWNKRPLSAMRLLGLVLSRQEMHCEGRITLSHLLHEDYLAANATDEDTEGAVNELLRVDGTVVAALVREVRPGRLRISVRSRGEYDVAEVCRRLGGGGHKNAAGCSLDGTYDQIRTRLLEALKECVGSC